jgi:hypothetical protein
MAELKDYPFVNQLNSPTLDGRPDENKWFNCVLAVLLSAMLYYRPELRFKITPDSMKDVVLGEGYANKGTDAAWFIPFVAKYGLKLSKIENMPGKLIEEAHKLIQAGKPAIFTEIDPYVDTSLPKYTGWTHVGSWYKEVPNGLVAMDPFGGKLVEDSDAVWASKIVGNELWTVELVEEPMMTISLAQPEVAHYFEQFGTDGRQWLCRQTSKVVQYGILAFYRSFGNSGLCGLTFLGLPKSNETPIERIPGGQHLAGHGIVVQFFERAALCYDPTHLQDNPPGAGSVYLLHLYTGGPGTDPEIAVLQAQIEKLKTQATPAPATPDPRIADYASRLSTTARLAQEIIGTVTLPTA